MTQEKNHRAKKEVLERYVAVWNGDSLSSLESIVTTGFVRHTTATSGPADSPEALRHVITHMRRDVPDLTIKVEDVLYSGNVVVFRWRGEGTDSGEGDFPPTNKRFRTAGLTWLRFDGERIAEEWTSTDQLDPLLQLGFTIVPPGK